MIKKIILIIATIALAVFGIKVAKADKKLSPRGQNFV